MSGEVEKCPILHVRPKFDVFTLVQAIQDATISSLSRLGLHTQYSVYKPFTINIYHIQLYRCIKICLIRLHILF